MVDFITVPVTHEQAREFIASKTAVKPAVFEGMLPELRGRAFAVSGIEDTNLLQRMRDRIADLPAGGDWDKIREEIATELTPFFVDPQAGAEAMQKQIEAANRRAELLVRTHGFQAYAATRYNEQVANADIQPYWQYKSFGDGRVRDTHRALDGIVLPAGHKFWEDHYPPWEWGCRCIVTGLSPEDVDEIRAEDADKAPDERRVLEGEFLRSVEQDKKLIRGPNKIVDLRSPVEKAESPIGKNTAYRWNPGDLRPDVRKLEARYSPQVWATFRQWAGSTDIGDGRTVWEWATAKPVRPATAPAAPRRRAAKKSEPAPIPAPAPAAGTKATPVAEKVLLKDTPAGPRKVAEEALAIIGRIHGDGPLNPVKVETERHKTYLGAYFRMDGRSVKIAVKPKAKSPRLTFIHEVGHWIDNDGLGNGRGFATKAGHEDMAEWLDAVKATKAYKAIIAAKVKPYWSSREELWARSYAQWIVERSGSKELLKELEGRRDGCSWIQWTKEDFAPVAAAIDALFRKKGWME